MEGPARSNALRTAPYTPARCAVTSSERRDFKRGHTRPEEGEMWMTITELKYCEQRHTSDEYVRT